MTGDRPRKEASRCSCKTSRLVRHVEQCELSTIALETVMDNKIEHQLLSSWDRQLSKSRPHWVHRSDLPFPYNRDAPSMAYDPAAIPSRQLGPFLHLIYSPPSEANDLSVTREAIESGHPLGNLAHEFVNELIKYPSRDDLIVIPNRWPRVSYHSLIVTREIMPQKLTQNLIDAELSWAETGFVVEFHRFKRILDHFHFHIYPGEYSPIFSAKDSFAVKSDFGHYEFGQLDNYPVPHIALRSRDRDFLTRSIERISNWLDDQRTSCGQILIKASDGSFVFMIFIRNDYRIEGMSFNLIGLIRTPKEVSLEDALSFAWKIHRRGRELSDTTASLAEVVSD